MFEQLSAPDHVIAMHLSGKVTREDVQQYKRLFDEKLAQHERIGVCVDLTGISDMSAEAMIEDAKVEFGLLAHLNQLSRCAVVSDKEWPRAFLGLAGPLLATVELMAFTPDRREAAMTWAAELPEAPTTRTPAFRFLPTTEDDVLGFEIDGVISSEEMPGVIKEFATFLERHRKVRLLARIKRLAGFDAAIFLQRGLISMKLAALQKVERYAVVGAPGWMRKIVDTVDPACADIDMRTFAADQEAEAWAWLGAEPAK